MKKLAIVCILLVTTLFSLSAQSLLASNVAIVNLYEAQIITQNEFKVLIGAMEQRAGRQLSLDERKQLLNQKINDVLLLQAAKNANIRVTDQQRQAAIQMAMRQLKFNGTVQQFQAAIEQNPQSNWNDFLKGIDERIIVEQFVLKEQPVLNVEAPSADEINSFYLENIQAYQHSEIIQLKHIYISTQNLSAADKSAAQSHAQDLYNKLNGGASFDDIVKFNSDDIHSRQRGGFIGPIFRNDPQQKQLLGETFFNKIFSLPLNTISPVIESNAGYHIVVVTAKVPAGTRSLDQNVTPESLGIPGTDVVELTVREQIKQAIIARKKQTLMAQNLEALVMDLRDDADITILEENLNW